MQTNPHSWSPQRHGWLVDLDFDYLEAGKAKFIKILESVKANSLWASEELSPKSLALSFPDLAKIETVDYDLLRMYKSPIPARAVVAWIHGGAFIGGSLDMPEADWVSRSISARGFDVFSIDYRKVDLEISFPIPNQDVMAGWQQASAHAKSNGLPTHLGGGSAGAAYAAALTSELISKSMQLPKSLALVYPVVHPVIPESNEVQAAATADIPEREYIDEQTLAGMHYLYAGSKENLSNPIAFAGLADLQKFPATFVLNSEKDLLRPSGELFAQQLKDANVRVRVDLEVGSRHGQLDDPFNPHGQSSIKRLIDWLENN